MASLKQMAQCILKEKLILGIEQLQPAASQRTSAEKVVGGHALVLLGYVGLASEYPSHLPCCKSSFERVNDEKKNTSIKSRTLIAKSKRGHNYNFEITT